MKIKQIIYIASLALLTACSDDITSSISGDADNAITLRAGISEGGAGVQTRAYEPDANHSKHVKFTQGTALTLRVDGVWLGKSLTNDLVSQTTTATIGDIVAETNDKHNNVTMSPQLYWDDYGSADPNNMPDVDGNGRDRGLDIFAVAVDNVTTAPTVSSWIALPWSLEADQTSGWSTKDLLTSNNVKKTNDENTTNPYKFDDRAAGKLLEFTHAMSKITVNLTAGAGFPGYETNPANAKFQQQPSVTLLNFNYTGTVNVESKISTPTSGTANIKAYVNDGASWVSAHTAQATAIVFPGNSFTDATDILKIEADGNVYYVNATKINIANTEASNTFEQGKNYILNITVNKTGIDVTATIKDWENVEAANEAPVINIDEAYGHEGTDFAKSFDFYRSTAVNGSYLTGITDGNHVVVNYVAATVEPAVPAHYNLTSPMYWPDHSTHYFFRGIWPLVNSTEGPAEAKVKANSIEVENVAYQTGHYPSDLMISRPRNSDGTPDETCKVDAHEKSSGANGICATEGHIRMNFQYAMSQVIVNLTTSTGDNKVIFDANTKVEIIGGYSQGEIKLSDESSDFTGKDVTEYTMHREGDSNILYHDAIIPQSLQDGEGNATLKFRITVKTGDTYDKYETVLGIKDIKVTEGGSQKNITAWEPGKKYTYTLNITKTGVTVTATLKDWVEVTASEDIWF